MIPPSDLVSDIDAPPNTFLTFRNGVREYVRDDVLEGKHIGLFFGANTPACWGFCRALTKIYTLVVKEHQFEVVYVSADMRRRDFERFAKSMPWLALPFRNNTALFARYGVPMDLRRWPVLVIAAPNDKVVFDDASDIARRCVHDGKPASFGELLVATRSETTFYGRFHTLFDPW